MRTVFADSFFFFALENPRDAAHLKATTFTRTQRAQLVTTGWVLTELGDGWAGSAPWRNEFVDLLKDIRANPHIRVIPLSDALFFDGVSLYSQRPDKDWSLT